MKLFELETYLQHSKLVGIAAIVICIIAWVTELTGMVYVCPYCRVQRTVIGLLGLMLILPISQHWLAKYAALVFAFFGAVVAANQHFMGWKKISAGQFEFNQNIAIDPFLLSGCALAGIIGLTYIILYKDKLPNLKQA